MPVDLSGLAGLVAQLRETGPLGTIIASVIVGLALAVMALAPFSKLMSSARTESRQVEFQAQCLAMISDLRATEQALRKRLDDESRGRAMLQDEVEDFRVQIALLRHQRRRLIDMLRGFVATLPEPAVKIGTGRPST